MTNSRSLKPAWQIASSQSVKEWKQEPSLSRSQDAAEYHLHFPLLGTHSHVHRLHFSFHGNLKQISPAFYWGYLFVGHLVSGQSSQTNIPYIHQGLPYHTKTPAHPHTGYTSEAQECILGHSNTGGQVYSWGLVPSISTTVYRQAESWVWLKAVSSARVNTLIYIWQQLPWQLTQKKNNLPKLTNECVPGCGLRTARSYPC